MWTSQEKPASHSTFKIIFKKWGKILKFRKRCGQHSRCKKCSEFCEWRAKATTVEAKREITAAYHKHMEEVRADRNVYARNILLSEKATVTDRLLNPDLIDLKNDVLSLVIDGMDAAKFACPRNVKSCKMWDGLWRPRLSMTGLPTCGIVLV